MEASQGREQRRVSPGGAVDGAEWTEAAWGGCSWPLKVSLDGDCAPRVHKGLSLLQGSG